jgi:hypothetical protein
VEEGVEKLIDWLVGILKPPTPTPLLTSTPAVERENALDEFGRSGPVWLLLSLP